MVACSERSGVTLLGLSENWPVYPLRIYKDERFYQSTGPLTLNNGFSVKLCQRNQTGTSLTDWFWSPVTVLSW